jgi:hypothetical protein
VVGEPGEGLGGFLQAGDGAGGEALFDGAADVVLGQDLGEAGDVVDVLFGVDGDELAAQFGEGVDDLGFEAAHAGVEGGKQPDRPPTDDRRVEDVVHCHRFITSAPIVVHLFRTASVGSRSPQGTHIDDTV